MTTTTLLPIEHFAGDRPLVALDVDGVFNRFNQDQGPERRLVRTDHGKKYWIDFDPLIVEAIEDVIRAHQLEIGWLTTWGPNVRSLVEQAFDGKLSGGYVLAKIPKRNRGFIPANWKFTALRDRLGVTGQSWVWVDDEAIAWEQINPDFDELSVSSAPGLFVPTASELGITFEQIDQIDRFVS